MARKAATKKRPGRPLKFKTRRSTLTVRLQAPVREQIEAAAASGGRSMSEEVEFRLNRDISWEASKRDILAMSREAADQLEASRIDAIKRAGFLIVQDAGGKVAVQVSPELLLKEADGILRSGFVAAEDVNKSPTEIMIERVILRALQKHEEGKGK